MIAVKFTIKISISDEIAKLLDIKTSKFQNSKTIEMPNRSISICSLTHPFPMI